MFYQFIDSRITICTEFSKERFESQMDHIDEETV